MVRRREHAQILEQWLAAIGHPDDRLGDACTAVVNALTGTPTELRNALTAFGQAMGLAGWPLSEIAAWLERLGRLAGPLAQPLEQFSSGIALAEGWAHGFLFGVHLGDATDP